MGKRKAKIVLIPPPVKSVEIDDPDGLGPLPEQGVSFLSQLGARYVRIVVKDGRSWIIAGLNEWKGKTRPFLARVFENGYVRDYLAIPPDSVERVVTSVLDVASKMEGEGHGEEEEKGE